MSLNNHNLTNKCNEFSEVVKVQCQEFHSLKVTLITKMLLIYLMLVLFGVSAVSVYELAFLSY
jgi:hypothetical protein